MFFPSESWVSAMVHETSRSYRHGTAQIACAVSPKFHYKQFSSVGMSKQYCLSACSILDLSCLTIQKEGATNLMGSVWSAPWRWNSNLNRVNISSETPWDRPPNHFQGLQLLSDGTWLTFIYYWLRSNLDQGSRDERLYISLSITRVFFTTLKTTYFILIYKALKLKRVGVKWRYFNLFLFTAYKTTSSLAAIAKC